MKNIQQDNVERLLASRSGLPHEGVSIRKAAEEGGCGVTGFIASIPVSGRHIFAPSVQMHNRGNGKGGGIAAVGLEAGGLGVSQDVLDSHYLLQVALLDEGVRPELEKTFVEPYFEVAGAGRVPTVDDYRDIGGLEVRPPDVWRYFVRVKPDVLANFMEANGFQDMAPGKAEDEFVYQNSFRINQRFYASLGDKKAFLLSHARNLMIMKIVGYAEQVAQYYRLEAVKAHGWIAHQRYPTRGRVWHPGGAHPFIGMDEALVHNGDFANYHGVSQYLRQHNVHQQFLTDTETAAQLFDLWNRVYAYPLEYIIEAMAPTTEHDLTALPEEKRRIYRYIQSAHIHSSPDGPWFFIIARNNPSRKCYQLIGITDTAMLRPQVFALQEGEVSIGLICSEKQAIDATLQSLAAEDNRFCPVADKYWNGRGGSATDGGAFIFTVSHNGNGAKKLICTNKFGEVVGTPEGQQHFRIKTGTANGLDEGEITAVLRDGLTGAGLPGLKQYCRQNIAGWDYAYLVNLCREVVALARQNDDARARAIELLTWLNDNRYATGDKKRSSVLQMWRDSLYDIFKAVPGLAENSGSSYRRIDWNARRELRSPRDGEAILVLDAAGFPPEDADCDARLISAAYRLGWRRFIAYGYKGQRFCGCGLGGETAGVRIDVYGSSGDYLASGIDGLEIYVHDNAQDQVGQILKRGKLVIYGDVGQTFMYGAKGGEVYVLGNAAGRPLINAVGRPRVVINGSCLDYLAESFMAGDPLNGGGFIVMNGLEFAEDGTVVSQPTPYPGANLFSLASGGAIYLRDPERRVTAEQLNGGEFVELTPVDWQLIRPYLEENERLFGISVEDDLLQVDREKREYNKVYRKVRATRLAVLSQLDMDEEY
jgi:glutamate synthase domain-containing protein 1/glutamate synthase domain-containing protein 3